MDKTKTVLYVRCITCKMNVVMDDPHSAIRPNVGKAIRGHLEGYAALGEEHTIVAQLHETE